MTLDVALVATAAVAISPIGAVAEFKKALRSL